MNDMKVNHVVMKYESRGTGEFDSEQQKQGNKLLALADITFTEDAHVKDCNGWVGTEITLAGLSTRQLMSLYLAIKKAISKPIFQREIRDVTDDAELDLEIEYEGNPTAVARELLN